MTRSGDSLTYYSKIGTYVYPAQGANAVRPHTPKSIAGNNLSYDANGNMTKRMDGSDITYDGENRPISVNSNAVTYKYGPRARSSCFARRESTAT